jgi:hypothetical protein
MAADLERRQCGEGELNFLKKGLETLEGLGLIGFGHEHRNDSAPTIRPRHFRRRRPNFNLEDVPWTCITRS